MNTNEKRIILVLIAVYTLPALASPPAPVLSVETDGRFLSTKWNDVSGADGYYFNFVKYPNDNDEPYTKIDLRNKKKLSGKLPLGSEYYLAISAYNNEGEGPLSNIELIEITEPNMYLDYIKNADIQEEEWGKFRDVLDQISPYYEEVPSPELNIEKIWFNSLQVSPDHFTTDIDLFDDVKDEKRMAITGVGFGGNYYTSAATTIIPYSSWSTECINCGSAFIIQYTNDKVSSLIYKTIEGSHNSWVMNNQDGSKSVAFIGHDESKFFASNEDNASAPSYFYNLDSKDWTSSEWSTEGHHSQLFDYDNDGDDDIFTAGWSGGGLGLMKNNDGEFERISLGAAGSSIAPIGYQNDGAFALYIGDAVGDSSKYGFEVPYNVIRFYKSDFEILDSNLTTLVKDAKLTPPAYYEYPSYDDVQNIIGDDAPNSHDIYAKSVDIDYDGDDDLIVSSQMWSDENPYSILQLLINNDGNYTDETEQRLFNWNQASSSAHMLAFIDINNDGFVDILSSDNGFPFRFHNWTIDGSYLSGSRVLINDGTGHFVSIIHHQIHHIEFDGTPGSQYMPTHMPWLNANNLLRWTVINAPKLSFYEEGIDLTTEVYTRKLNTQLSTGPNGIDPKLYGAPGYNEFYYLLHNEDVQDMVINGDYISGFAHYLDVGKSEGRLINAK